MNIRSKIAAATTSGLMAAGALAAFAPQAYASGTAVQLTVTTSGSISVTDPAPVSPATAVNLGTFAAGATAATSNALGTVTVTDSRTGILNNNWTASAVATDLVRSGVSSPTTQDTILAATIGYTAGTVTKGVGTPVAAVATGLTVPSLAAAVPVATMVALGANSATWSPTLSITVPATNIAGTYTGTVTHSVL